MYTHTDTHTQKHCLYTSYACVITYVVIYIYMSIYCPYGSYTCVITYMIIHVLPVLLLGR
jgi:hypothetical protein